MTQRKSRDPKLNLLSKASQKIGHLEKLLPGPNTQAHRSLSEVTPNLPSLHQCAGSEANYIRLIHCAEEWFPCFLQKTNEHLFCHESHWPFCYELSVEVKQFSNLFIWYYLGLSSANNSWLTDFLGMANVCKFILCCLVLSCGVPWLDDLCS